MAPFVLLGCLPVITVTTRTRIYPDGTTFRETRYVKERRNPDNDQEKEWNLRPLRDDLAAAVGDGFPSVERDDLTMTLAGTFADPGQVPADFMRDVAVLGSAARNRIEFAREDLLFGTRYVYRERFVDAIQPEDQKASRQELIEFLVGYFQAAVHHEFGGAYDTTALERYAEENLKRLLERSIDIYWAERRRLMQKDPLTGRTGLDRALEQLVKLLRREGLALDPAADQEENTRRFANWFQALLARTLLPKAPGDRRSPPPRPADFAYLFPAERPFAGLELALERAADAEYGGVAAAHQAFQRALLSVTGTFGSPPAEAEFRFDCAVEMPGALLRSNGYLEGGQSAFWLFDGEQLFPHGYVMEAESVVLDEGRLHRIRELRSSLDRRDAVRLVADLEEASAAERQVMARLLDRAAARGTLEALADAAALAPEEKEVMKKLEQVLQPLFKSAAR